MQVFDFSHIAASAIELNAMDDHGNMKGIFLSETEQPWVSWMLSCSKGPNEIPHSRQLSSLCRAVWHNGWESQCHMNPGMWNPVGFQHVGLGV